MSSAETSPPKRKRRAWKGTLAIVGLLFLGSAGLRLATEAGQAFANDLPLLGNGELTPALERALPATPSEIDEMLQTVKARIEELDEREQEVQRRERMIEMAQEEITVRLQRLEEAEADLRGTIELASTAAENDVAQLTAVYSEMKSKDAAALFEKMEPGFAAGFLARMASDKAAGILASLPPEKAYEISVRLASRNAELDNMDAVEGDAGQ